MAQMQHQIIDKTGRNSSIIFPR